VAAVSTGRRLLAGLARNRDIALAVVLCAGGEYELFDHVTYGGADVWPGPNAVNAVVIPLLTLPLAFRRRWPSAVSLYVLAGLAVTSIVLGGGEATTTFLLFLTAVFTGAAYARRPVLVAAAAVAAGVAHDLRDPQVHGLGDAVWGLGMLVAAWLIGWAVRTRQQRIGSLEAQAVEVAERHAEQVAAVTARERRAIARELHDVVTHAVSVIVIQAQAGARALPQRSEVAADALAQIEETGRSALAELRGLLTLLTDEDTEIDVHPAASLAQLDELLDRCRASGLRVDLDADDELPRLPALADLAAFRVVQEALTNTLRHAPGASARVTIRRSEDVLEVVAEDDGATGDARGSADESGRGLIGMRERLALAGGRLVAAGPNASGFRVHATVPLGASAATKREPIG
jgi:signal transduction histidine kinase